MNTFPEGRGGGGLSSIENWGGMHQDRKRFS